MSLIFLDTETTDLEKPRLVQLAYKVASTGEVVNELFKPPVTISYGAMAIHHITNEMVEGKPVFLGSETYQKLNSLLAESIVVAHNAPYDLIVLKNEGLTPGKAIDTLKVAQHTIKSEQYNLQYLRYSLHINVSGTAHDALGDIVVLEGVFNYLKQTVGEMYLLTSDEAIFEKMLELSATPVLLTMITFGKHKGKTYEQLASTERSYLEWLYRSESEKKPEEQKADMMYTLKHYLALP